jgi:hypothetical protein
MQVKSLVVLVQNHLKNWFELREPLSRIAQQELRNEEKLPAEEKQRIYHFMDLIMRNHNAKTAYCY